MNVCYVCTNFNNSAITLGAVETLKKNKGHQIKVVVVDNASRDSEVEILLAAQNDDFIVLSLKENVGYFAGLNAGIRYCKEHFPDYEWLAIGNNDLQFPVDFIDCLEKASDRLSQYAVISPDIVTLDGDHQNPHVISRISVIREIFYDIYYSNYLLGRLVHRLAKSTYVFTRRGDEKEWEQARPIYQGHGSLYILTPRFFTKFDELWAPTFLMSEEFFLSKQLSDQGEVVYYDPAIQVRHLWHATLSDVPSKARWEMAKQAHHVYRQYVKVDLLSKIKKALPFFSGK